MQHSSLQDDKSVVSENERSGKRGEVGDRAPKKKKKTKTKGGVLLENLSAEPVAMRELVVLSLTEDKADYSGMLTQLEDLGVDITDFLGQDLNNLLMSKLRRGLIGVLKVGRVGGGLTETLESRTMLTKANRLLQSADSTGNEFLRSKEELVAFALRVNAIHVPGQSIGDGENYIQFAQRM